MKSKRGLLIAIVLAAVSSVAPVVSPVSADAVPDEQFMTPFPPTADRYTAMLLRDDESARNPIVYLEAMDSANHNPNDLMTSLSVCSQIDDTGCTLDKYMLYSTVLQHCLTDSSHDCVSNVSATDDSGKSYQVNYIGNFPQIEKYTYAGNLNAQLPNGGSSFLVDIPDLPHQGGTKYLITTILTGSKDFGKSTFTLNGLQAEIYAVSGQQAECSLPAPEYNWQAHKATVGGFSHTGGGCDLVTAQSRQSLPCVQVDTTECLLSWPLPVNINFSLTLKLHVPVTGWLHGRLADVQANISSSPDGEQIVQVTGKPTTVPGIFAAFKKSALPPEIAAFYSNDPNADSEGSGWGNNATLIDNKPYSIIKTIYGYDARSFQEMLAWVDSVDNKATFSPTIWAFHSIPSNQSFNNCLNGSTQLSGVVTTNATMYMGEPPTFDQATQTLQYKVAAPHYTPSGDVFKGVYNLAIRSSVARCIYGFTSAPVSATVSIVGAGGDTEVATTALSEHDGWIYLKAAGFTFSSPVISVKFSQASSAPSTPAVSQASPAAPASPPPSPVVKKTSKTITCVKGKTSKKVTGLNRVCPSGFSRK